MKTKSMILNPLDRLGPSSYDKSKMQMNAVGATPASKQSEFRPPAHSDRRLILKSSTVLVLTSSQT
jgi:hypothetical protein